MMVVPPKPWAWPPIMPRMLLSSSEPPTTPAAAAAAVPRNEPPPPKGSAVAGLPITLVRTGLSIGALVVMATALRLLQHLARVPDRTAGRRRRNIRHRALFLAENRLPHGIEEAAGLLLLRCMRLFQFLDVRIGALQSLVLQQHGLHQRVQRIWRLTQTLLHCRNRVGVAWCALDLGKPVEEVVYQLAFLRCHGLSPCHPLFGNDPSESASRVSGSCR